MPYFEPSRQMPLSFMPPKRAISVEMMPSFMPTIWNSRPSATRQMRPISRFRGEAMRISVIWPPRGVADVYDPDRVPSHPVKDFIATGYQEHDANARPLSDRASAQRRSGNLGHNLLNTGRDALGKRWIAGPGVIGGDLSKISDGPLRILDPHACRKLANAALTSSSLAASPASPSSIAVSSSGVPS